MTSLRTDVGTHVSEASLSGPGRDNDSACRWRVRNKQHSTAKRSHTALSGVVSFSLLDPCMTSNAKYELLRKRELNKIGLGKRKMKKEGKKVEGQSELCRTGTLHKTQSGRVNQLGRGQRGDVETLRTLTRKNTSFTEKSWN